MNGQFEETERFLFSAYFSEDSRRGIIIITFKDIFCTNVLPRVGEGGGGGGRQPCVGTFTVENFCKNTYYTGL